MRVVLEQELVKKVVTVKRILKYREQLQVSDAIVSHGFHFAYRNYLSGLTNCGNICPLQGPLESLEHHTCIALIKSSKATII